MKITIITETENNDGEKWNEATFRADVARVVENSTQIENFKEVSPKHIVKFKLTNSFI